MKTECQNLGSENVSQTPGLEPPNPSQEPGIPDSLQKGSSEDWNLLREVRSQGLDSNSAVPSWCASTVGLPPFNIDFIHKNNEIEKNPEACGKNSVR